MLTAFVAVTVAALGLLGVIVDDESPDWRQVAEVGAPLPWVQPHAGSEYPAGVTVTHKGRLWRNDLGRPNGWEPGAVGASWTDLGPV